MPETTATNRPRHPEARKTEATPELTSNDLNYLRSILRNLNEYKSVTSQLIEQQGFTPADDALADNRDWLDCFIERHNRRLTWRLG